MLRLALFLCSLIIAQACSDNAWQIRSSTLSASKKVELDQIWFLEFRSPPTSRGGNQEELLAERNQFAEQASNVDFLINYDYRAVWNGISVSLARADDIDALRKLTSVKAVYPVELMTMAEEPEVMTLEMASAINMTATDRVHQELGYRGQGIRVAVIDSGIDYDHPDFGGCFGPMCRVEFGYDFVGDDFGDGSGGPPQPDNDPDDPRGHGTHVAGIIGANGNVVGVAPDVTLGAYKVFGREGYTRSDITIAALERAFVDNMDVINASLGNSFGWSEGPHSTAVQNLIQSGAVVVASAGNADELGMQALSNVGAISEAISVASFDNEQFQFRTAETSVSSDDLLHMPFWGTASPPSPLTSGSYRLQMTVPRHGCPTLPAGAMTGRVALMRRGGGCNYYEKVINAQNAGAVAVLIYNNRSGRFWTATANGSPAITIPVSGITGADGNVLRSELTSGSTVTITYKNTIGFEDNSRAFKASTFCSYGPNVSLDFKPNVGAPGGRIHSTYPLERGGYGTAQGTSMSAPHIAGIVALIKEAHPNLSPNEVKARLQNTAQPQTPPSGRWVDGFYDHVHVQGAGLANAKRAIETDIEIQPSAIALGEIESGTKTQVISISNSSTNAITLQLTHMPALSSTNTPSSSDATAEAATVQIVPAEISVGPSTSAQVSIEIAAPSNLAEHAFFGGYILIEDQANQETYHLPFMGFKGDYQGVSASIPTAENYPWLIKLPNEEHQAMGANYSLVGDDEPTVQFYLEWPVDRARIEVKLDGTYRGPNGEPKIEPTRPEDFRRYSWGGFVRIDGEAIEVPDGTYDARFGVLRPLGDPNNPSDWQYAPLPQITLDRPNRPPEFDPFENIEVAEGESISVVFSVTDINRDTLTFNCLGLPDGAELDANLGRLTWDTDYDDAGEYNLSLYVSDGIDGDTVQLKITVTDVNRAPVLVPVGALTGKEGERLEHQVAAIDPDGDNVYFAFTSTPSGALIGPTTGLLAWDVNYQQAGTHILTIQANDGLLVSSITATVSITNTNRAPVVQLISNITISETETLKFTVLATDADGDEISFGAPGLPTGATFSEAAEFAWTPDYSQAGIHEQKFQISDGIDTVEETVKITVIDIGDPPRPPVVKESGCGCHATQIRNKQGGFIGISLLVLICLSRRIRARRRGVQ